jgi:DNA-binding NarL/FixJ family response regulator
MNGCEEALRGAGNFSTTPSCVAGGNDSAPIRIWMVDDNSTFRSLLANLLNEEGGLHIEQQFPSPTAVLKALAFEEPPDVILLDIEMGEENGLDAVGPIKALAKNTHVLMLTTFAGPLARERAFREGASDFMFKTWTVPEIALHVRRAMEFGSVANLMTAFLNQTKRVEQSVEARKAQPVAKSKGADRWWSHLRGWMKLSPS